MPSPSDLPEPRPERRLPLRRRLLLGLAALAVVLGSGWLGFTLSQRQATEALRAQASHRLDLFAMVVQGVIKRLEHVPATVQLNQDILALLREPGNARRVDTANTYLRRLNAHLGSISVFVLDERGIVLASSNAGEGDDSLVGEDLSFRPYFLEALSGRVGRHFAIGVKQGEPGYFVSHPIRDGARVVGVAAIKIGLQAVDEAWSMLGAPALLADANQVVILSSEPSWRYTALVDLPLEQRVDVEISRLYDDRPIDPFPLPVQLRFDEDGQVVDGQVSGGASPREQLLRRDMLLIGRSIDGMNWRLLTFLDLRQARNQALEHAMLSALVAGFMVLLALFLGQRRSIQRQRLEAQRLLEQANANLEQKVARRTRALTDTNARLRREVAERVQAAQTLRAAQDELVQAAKLAVVGQLAAGITHELTQPLGAIRTLSGNAAEFLRRGNLQAVSGNLELVARLSDQMGGIIQPLKAFARKSPAIPARCDVAIAMGNALFLFQQRLTKEGVALRNECDSGRVFAWCDQNRLEQVLINLIANALDAMREAPRKELTLRAEVEADAEPAGVRIDVLDTGSGFSSQALDRVFEPFFTTKPVGAGLGLGLVISRDIARDFHGELEAANRPEGGARLTLRLPAAPEPEPENPEP
ncbi:ATP-binding protein [Azohydromonas caseinilytica]|uniref:C4-dicarboxylate transport sensor protein DctB n=1 Tax=Azohydromonas caseinilytica TaxID=2728836 RepID=A0A848FKI4_9BURK|nr:ATP-binding protein [Azohydromonas caseinilytica]NML18753.1 sensor histidine kinase [Azohydromonas caseinilytica]